MAYRMLTDLATAARKSGLKVVEVDGWKARGRPRSKGEFYPVGTLAHHTGSNKSATDKAELSVLVNGRAGLPGPLCHLGLSRNGTVYVVAAGRANHAGTVRSRGKVKAGDGNAQLLGIEAFNSGYEGWSAKQLDAYHRLVAAANDHYRWDRDDVWGHGEVSTAGKWDPGVNGRMIDMNQFRSQVRRVGLQPVEAPPLWYSTWLRNVGGFNAQGAKTIDDRLPLIVDDIADSPYFAGSVQAILELPNPKVKRFDALMRDRLGYERIVGTDGRYLYAPAGTVVRLRGTLEAPKRTLYQGDDKQAAYASLMLPAQDAALRKQGKKAEALVMVSHLEHEAPANTERVQQMGYFIDQGEVLAKRRNLGASRILHVADTNSDEWVRDKAAEPRGYVDTMEIAHTTTNPDLHTFVGWGGSGPVGPGVDYTFTRSNRLIHYTGVRRKNVKGLYDHLPVCVGVGWGVK